MALFYYKSIDEEGNTVEDTVEFGNKYEVYELIKDRGDRVVSVREVSKKAFSFRMEISLFSSVKMHDKIVFARNLSQMIDAGLPITRGLSIMERQAKKGTLKKTLADLQDSLSKGNTLSDSMSRHPKIFSTLFVSMVSAGEESGNLSLALKNISMQMEKTYLLTKKIKGAMMYPAVIFSLMIVIAVLMMVYMVPTLTETFTGLGVELPLSTRIIIMISNFLKGYFLFVILGTLALIVGLVLWFRTNMGKIMLDTVSLRIPIIGEMVKQMNSARTARTLSSLISSGVDIVVAIGVTKEVIQNSYYKNVLTEIETAIEKGEQISNIFLSHDNLYPLFVGEMVSVGEETGKIGEMLLGVATFYEEEVDQKTKDLSSVIEPLLMIVIGTAVGIFAISMLAPTYSLADAL
ncbi:MAG: type II secretion system F family protein [Candidatus Paceibacterota bacterium]